MVGSGRDLLERHFADLVDRSGVSYAGYARDTTLLTKALGIAEKHADRGHRPRDASTPALPPARADTL